MSDVVTVRYYAVLAERAGVREEHLDPGDARTVAQAIDTVGERHEVVRVMRPVLGTAVNDAWATPDHPLAAGDVLSLIPPVSGG